MKTTVNLGILFIGSLFLSALLQGCGEDPSASNSGVDSSGSLTSSAETATNAEVRLNENGQELYLRTASNSRSCSICHGADGKGTSRGSNLTKSLPSGTSLQRAVNSMWTSGSFSAMSAALSDQELNDLVEYILYLGGATTTTGTPSTDTPQSNGNDVDEELESEFESEDDGDDED
ncbi:MAG: cytochrome c [SAR324 cluster bacterium]|nr:cytochrome c [SAR324 cluster bacterium]